MFAVYFFTGPALTAAALWLIRRKEEPQFLASLKNATPVGAVFLAIFALFGFLISSEREARRPFLDKQLQTCSEIAGIAGTLATSSAGDEQSWVKADAHFWEYYWGRLGIFEDASLEGRMIQFGDMLLVVEGILWNNEFWDYESTNARHNLRHAALCLAHTCRGLTEKNWSVLPLLIRSPEAKYNEYCQMEDPVYFCYCTKYANKMSQPNCLRICLVHRTQKECDELLQTYNPQQCDRLLGLG